MTSAEAFGYIIFGDKEVVLDGKVVVLKKPVHFVAAEIARNRGVWEEHFFCVMLICSFSSLMTLNNNIIFRAICRTISSSKKYDQLRFTFVRILGQEAETQTPNLTRNQYHINFLKSRTHTLGTHFFFFDILIVLYR